MVHAPGEWQWSSYCATAGISKGHSSLTREWILGQFGNRRRAAQRRYREFVEAGRGAKRMWEKVQHQSILGEEDFAEALKRYVKGYEEVEEIPRKQRLLNRLSLNEIFEDEIDNKKKRNEKMQTANYEYGYSQREIADYLGLHYSTVSRLINNKLKKRSK